MRRLAATGFTLLALAIGSAALAAPAGTFGKDIPTVTLSLHDASAQDAMAQVAKATGVQIAVQEDLNATVTADIQALPLEQAIDAIVQTMKGSWMRFYLIEAEGPPQEPYTAAEVIKFLEEARRDYVQRMSPAQRSALGARWQEMLRSAAGETEHQVGARIARSGPPRAAAPEATPPTDEPGAPAGVNIGRLLSTHDPLRELVSPEYRETISLDVKDAPLQRALDELHTASGFAILPDEDLKGNISLQMKDGDLEQAIDQIATAVGAKWRRVYVVSKPRPQTPQQLEKRIDEGIDRGIAEFWQRTPEERQRIVAEITQRLQGLTPQQRAMAKALPFASHILQKVVSLGTTLSAQQRQEIAPAVREVMKLFGGG